MNRPNTDMKKPVRPLCRCPSELFNKPQHKFNNISHPALFIDKQANLPYAEPVPPLSKDTQSRK